MPKDTTFIVRNSRGESASSVSVTTLPGGRRVHSLDRAVFEKAVGAANNYISRKQASVPPAQPPKSDSK